MAQMPHQEINYSHGDQWPKRFDSDSESDRWVWMIQDWKGRKTIDQVVTCNLVKWMLLEYGTEVCGDSDLPQLEIKRITSKPRRVTLQLTRSYRADIVELITHDNGPATTAFYYETQIKYNPKFDEETKSALNPRIIHSTQYTREDYLEIIGLSKPKPRRINGILQREGGRTLNLSLKKKY
jgi:hypothetical protein